MTIFFVLCINLVSFSISVTLISFSQIEVPNTRGTKTDCYFVSGIEGEPVKGAQESITSDREAVGGEVYIE